MSVKRAPCYSDHLMSQLESRSPSCRCEQSSHRVREQPMPSLCGPNEGYSRVQKDQKSLFRISMKLAGTKSARLAAYLSHREHGESQVNPSYPIFQLGEEADPLYLTFQLAEGVVDVPRYAAEVDQAKSDHQRDHFLPGERVREASPSFCSEGLRGTGLLACHIAIWATRTSESTEVQRYCLYIPSSASQSQWTMSECLGVQSGGNGA